MSPTLQGLGVFALVCLAVVGIQRCSARGTVEQFNRLSECAPRAREVPTSICVDSEWRQIWADIESEYAQAQALYADSPFTLRALRETHQQFREGLMYRPSLEGGSNEIESTAPPGFSPHAFVNIMSEVNLPEQRMRHYLRFLRRLDMPRPGLLGRWISLNTELYLRGNSVSIRIQETGPEAAPCTMHARATTFREQVVIDDAPVPAWRAMLSAAGLQLGPDQPLSGWSLRVERDGSMLDVEELDPSGRRGDEDRVRPYCGGSLTLAGAYFPAR